MKNNLKKSQTELAEYMSELSEKAYNAGWMEGLEYHLWQIANNKAVQYGRLEINDEVKSKLKSLSEKIGGWIYFDDINEVTFIKFDEWSIKVKEYF